MQRDPARSPAAAPRANSPSGSASQDGWEGKKQMYLRIYISERQQKGGRTPAGRQGGMRGRAAPPPPAASPGPGSASAATAGWGAAPPPQGAATSCPGQPFPSSSSSLPSLLLRLFSDSKKLKSSLSPPSPPLRQGAAGGTRAPTHRHKRSEPCQILPMAAAAAAAAAAETAPSFSSSSTRCAS